jgi:hypothetical protein
MKKIKLQKQLQNNQIILNIQTYDTIDALCGIFSFYIQGCCDLINRCMRIPRSIE